LRKNKKGISPLIATVLLIGFTIVLAALVMRWGGTLFRETTQTTGCEAQGRIACSSQVDISVGTIDCTNIANCISIQGIVVNNEGATQTIDGLNVQRKLGDGSIENIPVTISGGLNAGESKNTGNLGSYINPGLNLEALYVTPIFTQTTSDGGSCKIVCQEQTETILVDDPRIQAIP